MKPKRKQSHKLWNKPSGTASRPPRFSRSVTRPCFTRSGNMGSQRRRATTSCQQERKLTRPLRPVLKRARLSPLRVISIWLKSFSRNLFGRVRNPPQYCWCLKATIDSGLAARLKAALFQTRPVKAASPVALPLRLTYEPRLRNRQRDRLALGVASGSRGNGNRVVSRRRSAHRSLRRFAAVACGQQKKQAEGNAKDEYSRDPPSASITSNSHAQQRQSRNQQPHRIELSRQ